MIPARFAAVLLLVSTYIHSHTIRETYVELHHGGCNVASGNNIFPVANCGFDNGDMKDIGDQTNHEIDFGHFGVELFSMSNI